MITTSFLNQLEFFTLLGAAFLVSTLPYVKKPFLWAETFFHEISHGFMAILTGGRIVDFKLNFDGSGYCSTRGGFHFFVLLAGYAGASIFGALIFLAAQNNNIHSDLPLTEFLCLFILACHIIWGRGLSTHIIGIFILAVIYIPSLIAFEYANHITALFGLHVCINAIKAPIELWRSTDKGDARDLARITFIPSYAWILLWLSFSSYSIFWLWQQST